MHSLLAEEIMDLQKDLIIFLFFGHKKLKCDKNIFSFYRDSFIEILNTYEGISDSNRKSINDFFHHAETILSNEKIYNQELALEFFVDVFCSEEFNQCLLRTSSKLSPSENSKAELTLKSFIEQCIQKSIIK